MTDTQRAKPAKARGRKGGTPPPAHRFKPGQSGNPSGRPKGTVDPWARIRAKLLETISRKGPHNGKQIADVVAEAFVAALLKGKWPQMKELLDREEGVTPERIEHSGSIGNGHDYSKLSDEELHTLAELLARAEGKEDEAAYHRMRAGQVGAKRTTKR